jgi:hypothetical protein
MVVCYALSAFTEASADKCVMRLPARTLAQAGYALCALSPIRPLIRVKSTSAKVPT